MTASRAAIQAMCQAVCMKPQSFAVTELSAGYLRSAKQALKAAVLERAACIGLAAQRAHVQPSTHPPEGSQGHGADSEGSQEPQHVTQHPAETAAQAGPSAAAPTEYSRYVLPAAPERDVSTAALYFCQDQPRAVPDLLPALQPSCQPAAVALSKAVYGLMMLNRLIP